MSDAQALRILRDAYWSSASAFLASLSARCLPWRSVFGSYAVIRRLEAHEFEGEYWCDICGETQPTELRDLSRLSFVRHRWGGLWSPQPALYAAFDLEQFARERPPSPTATDLRLFSDLLRLLRTQDPRARPSTVEPRIRAVLPRSNAWERRQILEILGYAGTLKPAGYATFFEQWVPFRGRPERIAVPKNGWAIRWTSGWAAMGCTGRRCTTGFASSRSSRTRTAARELSRNAASKRAQAALQKRPSAYPPSRNAGRWTTQTTAHVAAKSNRCTPIVRRQPKGLRSARSRPSCSA